MAIGDEGNVKWVDGLRGVASAMVVIKHITAGWFTYLLWPSSTEDESPMILQLPYFRFPVQGRIGVAIFCLVTGYVSSIKPVKLFNQGNQNHAYISMSKSAIRRLPRLFIPVALVITLSCIATQLGAFEIARHCDGYGMLVTSPERRSNIFSAIYAGLRDLTKVWTNGKSEYGSELWTMMPILKGAFWVYVYLLATSHVQQRWRMVIALFLTLFRAASNDSYFGMQFFFGAFLADLQNLDPGTFSRAQSWSTGPVRAVMSVVCLLLGLFIASYPDKNYAWQPWSNGIHNFLAAILPEKPDFPRFASGIGLDIIAIGLHLSPLARNVLSNRFFLWLGRMSFAVYLLHNQILRSVLCWMIYGLALPEEEDEILKRPGPLRILAVLPVYFILTYGCAQLWTWYVDALSGRVAERIVSYIKEDTGEKTGPPLLPQNNRQ